MAIFLILKWRSSAIGFDLRQLGTTTHEEYIHVVDGIYRVQNLVGIGNVVFKMCEFQYYASLS